MKKIVLIISIFTASFSGCSMPLDDQKAEQEAVQRIKNAAEIEIENAKGKLNLVIADIISKADTNLTQKYQTVENAMDQKAEAIEHDLGGRIQGIENRITKSYIVGGIGTIIGLIGLIIAILAYKKETNIDIIKCLIAKEVTQNTNILSCIRNVIGTTNNRQQQSPISSTITQQQVKREIECYLYSKKFKDYLERLLREQDSNSVQPCVLEEDLSANMPKPIVQSISQPLNVVKTSYELYAKESNSMQLSSIQNSYQKGKSIYKLILTDLNSNTAQISLCVEQEDAKERILAYDNQYLEPICLVSRLSSQPTNVEVKSVGTAEKIGEEWKVNKQIIVEIK